MSEPEHRSADPVGEAPRGVLDYQGADSDDAAIALHAARSARAFAVAALFVGAGVPLSFACILWDARVSGSADQGMWIFVACPLVWLLAMGLTVAALVHAGRSVRRSGATRRAAVSIVLALLGGLLIPLAVLCYWMAGGPV